MLTEVGLLVRIILFFQIVWMSENFQDIQLGKSFFLSLSSLIRTIYNHAILQRESVPQNMS